MRLRFEGLAAVVTVFLSIPVPAVAAPEDSSDERLLQAQSLIDQGKKLAESNPKGALGAFRLSDEIYPNFRVKYNIARLCVRLQDEPCALAAFEQYLRDGGNEVPAKRRKEVEAELKRLGGRTSLAIKTSVNGAYVKVDGVVVGRTPLDKPVPVSAGPHKVVLVSDGNVIERSVQVALGAAESVDFDVVKEAKEDDSSASAPVVPPSVPEPEPATPKAAPEPRPPQAVVVSSNRRGAVPVVPWVVTGALAAGTIVMGVLAAGASSDYESTRDQFPITRDALDTAHSKATNLLLVTSILGATTLAAGGIAGYFTLSRGIPPADKAVSIAVGPGGITMTGRLP